MSKLLTIVDNKKITFIPDAHWEILLKLDVDKISNVNDAYMTYKNIDANLTGTVILLDDLSKEKLFCKQVREEVYEEYKSIIKTRDFSKDTWIWNIINGVSEQNDILYRCEEFLIIPNYTWNKQDVTHLHVLTIPSDPSLYTLRSLRGKHVGLLKEMKAMSLKMIESVYGLKESELKIYFHYAPQTYHLHIHFAALLNDGAYSSVAYSYDLDSVIFNLQLCSKYYKLFNIKKRI